MAAAPPSAAVPARVLHVRLPYSPLSLLVFVLLLGVLVAFVQIGLLTIAFDKLGLSADSAFLLLFASLFGSGINLPLFTVRASPPRSDPAADPFGGLLRVPPRPFTGRTLVAVNVGGCLLPLGFCAYLLAHHPLSPLAVVSVVAIVAAVCHRTSRPVAGLGIAMPMLVAPITAALVALLIDPAHSAPLAYIGGTLGVLLGADVLHLDAVRRLGAPVASIGGAGTFDGIFITGLVAVLLA